MENTLLGLISKEDEFCATRRSAGLPFMLQAILESQPVIESELFRYSVGLVLNQCMNDKEENDTIRTHCLNILRALFRHNKLGSTLDYLTTEIFHVAHLALNSSNFAVSNQIKSSILLLQRIIVLKETNYALNLSKISF